MSPLTDVLPRILLVDDETALLDGLSRRLHRDFDVTVAEGGAEALEIAEATDPFDVVVSDMRMPGMDGAALLERFRELYPDTVRILLTGFSDIDAAMRAINLGQIFRFLCKPCEHEQLIKSLRDAVTQHGLVVAERELLEKTLRGSVQALVETLSLANPAAFARAIQIKDVVMTILDGLEIQDRWEIEVASLLSQLGAVTLPDTTVVNLHFGLELSDEERGMVDRMPEVTDRLLAEIPRLEGVRLFISEQNAPPTRHDLSFGGRVLRIAVEYSSLLAGGTEPDVAVEALQHRYGKADTEILMQLGEPLPGGGGEVIEVYIEQLVPGMTLDADVRSTHGTLVVARGQVVTESLVERLRNYAANKSVVGKVTVLVG